VKCTFTAHDENPSHDARPLTQRGNPSNSRFLGVMASGIFWVSTS
jgi:hypothetical protein